MSTFRIVTTFFVILIAVFHASPSNGRKVIEDLVEIEQIGRKIFASRDGIPSTPLELKSKEEVLWIDSGGYVGALITNKRFVVTSLYSSSWMDKPLKSDETHDGSLLVSPTLALFMTKDRVICFDAMNPRFIEPNRSLREEFLEAEVNDYVAVVVSSTRALGFGTDGSSFKEIRFKRREIFQSIRTTQRVATVTTNFRRLTFNASSSFWAEVRL
ncbi:hypothetical protein D3OALGB2SA_2499 [Olavius algarvensis associated proteobacterium Delta 3]|nr:hypothetical protein D3OALGB2SA_2499 [Olavius algarvensis associated proteobacterium Delta 3]